MILKYVALTASAIFLIGCGAPNGTYQNPIQNLHNMSLNEVKGYSIEMQSFIEINGNEKALISAQEAAKKNLKDPDSAKFQNLRIADYEGGKVVCGELNAKNSYGGYVGFKRFVSGVTSATTYTSSSKYQNINDASNAGIRAACGY